ncbi:aminotransferase [Thecamonas trahens ATCC 50062]|uniref:Aminotransferase n=1 Tax=Thecamonas trahens ATCC 50062 TaxID=461836 RepID=A0A0L0DRA6_THETB|nr:aminotransferase [Thecamonas trahens ATCC 50062]KNC54849.1 aminotransferase [Thecamonas trahens ATCC 50062]|eukprot:XP_013761746.1 aminotransferase [Thecamonas trahens ATCC 50062]
MSGARSDMALACPLRAFGVERYFAKYEFTAPHLLCCSDCETRTVGEVMELAGMDPKELMNLSLGYTESPGEPELRAAIAEHVYESKISPENVLVFAGAEEGIYVAMRVVLAPGDAMICATPCYTSLSDIATDMGVDVRPWVAKPEDDWALDVDELVAALAVEPVPKMVVLMAPANPTGALLTPDELQRVVAAVEDADALLLCDEVYRGLEREGTLTLPAAVTLSDSHTMSLGVMSKSYGLAGLRIGWLATRSAALYDALLSYKDYTSICCSGPSQLLSVAALRASSQLLARNNALIATNMELLTAFMTTYAHLFVWSRPTAAPICFPRLNVAPGELTADAFAAALVDAKGVLLLPGSTFNYDNRHFRLGYGRADFPAVLAQLEAFLLDNDPNGGALMPPAAGGVAQE